MLARNFKQYLQDDESRSKKNMSRFVKMMNVLKKIGAKSHEEDGSQKKFAFVFFVTKRKTPFK